MNHDTAGHGAMHIARHSTVYQSQKDQFNRMLIDGVREHPIVFAVLGGLFLIANLVANWRIVSRAGYPGIWSLMLLVPCVNILFLLGLAWHPWPIEGKKR